MGKTLKIMLYVIAALIVAGVIVELAPFVIEWVFIKLGDLIESSNPLILGVWRIGGTFCLALLSCVFFVLARRVLKAKGMIIGLMLLALSVLYAVGMVWFIAMNWA